MFSKVYIAKVITNRNRIAIGIIRFILVIEIFASIYELNWMTLFVSSLALILSFSPELFRRRYQIELPNFFQFFIILFVFATLFLGEIQSFYFKYWWWDSLLHLLSGVALGFIGFLIVYILYKTGRFSARPMLLAVLAFCFALAAGVLWEVFEYSSDKFLNLNMQNARNLCEVGTMYCNTRLGVVDTMRDLILDTVGALYASFIGYLYLRRSKQSFFQSMVAEFESKNKHLFVNNDTKL